MKQTKTIPKVNMSKQTAVQLILDKFSLLSDGDFKYWMINNYDELIEMEREQTLDFTRNAVRKILDEDRQNPFNLEQYYNETYGGQDE
jgi:hypothetical protein